MDDISVLMTVGVRSVPPSVRRLVTLEGSDYADYFVASTSGASRHTAEHWARTILEGTTTGRSAPKLWRLLGLQLGPAHSPDHVQGWHITGRGDDWLRAETSSWYMTAQAIVSVDGDEVSSRARSSASTARWPVWSGRRSGCCTDEAFPPCCAKRCGPIVPRLAEPAAAEPRCPSADLHGPGAQAMRVSYCSRLASTSPCAPRPSSLIPRITSCSERPRSVSS